MATDLRAAGVAAVAAIAGAAVGGLGTYLSTQTTLNKQLAREERVEQIGSRGTARVYAEQLAGADAILGASLVNGRWPSRAVGKLFDFPTLGERRLVMSHLSPGLAGALAGGDAAMRSVVIDLDTKAGDPVDSKDRRKILVASAALERGELALQQLSESEE